LNKGDLVVVTGKVKSREWQDKEGNKRVSWEVAADHVAVDLVRHGASSSRVDRKSEPVVDDPWSKPADDVAPF
jgi:single-strand DNA-binding protein